MNPSVDQFLLEGCGRCELVGTPTCKVHNWTQELQMLRAIALESGLKEERKWGVPVYTDQGKNIMNIGALKNFCAMGFFKGFLLRDPVKLLVAPGPNSQAVMQFKVTEVAQVVQHEKTLLSYIREAIEIERSGKQVDFKAKPLDYPEELNEAFAADQEYQTAFESLTPGRQRSYLLHFNQAKQSKTRTSRIAKCRVKVFSGKGFNEY